MEGTSRSPQKDVSIEITKEDGSLISSIKEKMEKVSLSPCIYRVRETLSKDNADKYFPTFISIGPFHHGKDNLRATEDHKWRYLNTLFTRKPNVETSLDSVKALKEMASKSNVETIMDNCVKALKEMESKVRKFYSEEIHLPSDEFVKMMLLDGCFIIELFLTSSTKGLRRRDDPFFSTFESSYSLRCDLILLENQIPFFVLQRLFDLIPIPKQCTRSVTQLALHFFRRIIQGDVHVLEEKFSQEFKHLLDLIHQCHLPTYPESRSTSGRQRNLQSAINIQKAGITLKRNKTDLSLLDIKFVNRVLEIPTLKFHNYTEILLRNLIAMENSVHGCTKKVTSYVFLMGDLIQSKEDLRLLCKREIIVERFEKEGEILDLFKNIRVKVNMDDFYYRGICDEVNGYGRNELPVLCRKIKHGYSKTPFGLAGLVVAVLILVVTFTGILFSLLSFTLHHHF